MRIYTRRGDEGATDLRTGDRISKTSPRIEAMGTVDEVNALVGRVRPTGYEDLDDRLREIQNHLHVLEADLSKPVDGDPDSSDSGGGDAESSDGPRVGDDDVALLEEWIDAADADLEPLSKFVLPAGSTAGADLHHARTVCRRAERRAVALADAEPVNAAALAYLNRLSDLLFVYARLVNHRDGYGEEHPHY